MQLDGSSPIVARDVAFRFAPRLNAPGRLGPPDLALELLLARSDAGARDIAARVEALSVERRALQEAMTAEAIDEIERDGFAERPAIVVGREGWSSGIVGIVAGRLSDRYARPVVVVGFDRGAGRGSVRGPKGARLHDALASIGPVLDRFGGHQAAAGLEVRVERLAELRSAFERAIEAQGPPLSVDDPRDAVRLVPDDEPRNVVLDIERLEPCGQGNPAPRLVVEGRVLVAREVRGGHLKLELQIDGGNRLRCFGATLGSLAKSLGSNAPVTALGELGRDKYVGGGAVELKVDRVLQ